MDDYIYCLIFNYLDSESLLNIMTICRRFHLMTKNHICISCQGIFSYQLNKCDNCQMVSFCDDCDDCDDCDECDDYDEYMNKYVYQCWMCHRGLCQRCCSSYQLICVNAADAYGCCNQVCCESCFNMFRQRYASYIKSVKDNFSWVYKPEQFHEHELFFCEPTMFFSSDKIADQDENYLIRKVIKCPMCSRSHFNLRNYKTGLVFR